MSASRGQITIAANAVQRAEAGQQIMVHTGAHSFTLSECSTTSEEDGTIMILAGLDRLGNEVLIDVAQIVAATIVPSVEPVTAYDADLS